MAIAPQFFTTQQAAKELGVVDSRIRQILRDLHNNGVNLGTKIGRAWLLTKSDIEYIRNLPDGRTAESKKFAS